MKPLIGIWVIMLVFVLLICGIVPNISIEERIYLIVINMALYTIVMIAIYFIVG